MAGQTLARQRTQGQESQQGEGFGGDQCVDAFGDQDMEGAELWGNQAMAEFLGLSCSAEGEPGGGGAVAGPGGPGDQLGSRIGETEARSQLPGVSPAHELPSGQEATVQEAVGGMELGEGGGVSASSGAPSGGGGPIGPESPPVFDPLVLTPPTVQLSTDSELHIVDPQRARERIDKDLLKLGRQGEQYKGRIDTQSEGAIATLRGNAADDKTKITTSVETHAKIAADEVTKFKDALTEHVATLAESVTGLAASCRGQVRVTQLSAIAQLDSAAETEKSRLVGEGQAIAKEACEKGQTIASELRKRASSQAARATALGAQVIRRYSRLDADVVEEVTEAVQGVASTARTESIKVGESAAKEAIRQADDLGKGAQERCEDLAEEMLDQLPERRTEIETLCRAGIEQIDCVEKSAKDNLNAALSEQHGTADRLGADGVKRYEDAGSVASKAIDTSLESAERNIRQSKCDYVDWVDGIIKGFEDQLLGAEDVDPEAVGDAVDQLIAALEQGAEAQSKWLAKGVEGFAETLAQGTIDFEADLATSDVGLVSTLSQAFALMICALDEHADGALRAIGGTAGSVDEGTLAVVKEVSEALCTHVDEKVTEVRGEFVTGLDQVRTEGSNALDVTDRELTQLPGKLEQAAEQARESAEGSWWGSVTGFLSGAFSAILQFVGWTLVALAGAALLVLAGVSVALLLKIALIVAVVALVVVAVISTYQRFAEYRDFYGEGPTVGKGLLMVLAGIGDAVGISQVIEASQGRRFFTGREMTDEERGSHFTNGAIALLSTLLMVREFTAVGQVTKVTQGADDVARVAGASDDVAQVADDAGRVVGASDDAANVADDLGRAAGSSDDIASATDDLARAGDDVANVADDLINPSRWDDPSLSPDELFQLYQQTTKRPSLDRAAVHAKHSAGLRYDPNRSRWVRPRGRTGNLIDPSRWDDPSLSPDELFQLYQQTTKRPSLDRAKVHAKYSAGERYDPNRSRWVRPRGRNTSGPASAADDARNTSGPASASDEIASAADEARGSDRIASASDETRGSDRIASASDEARGVPSREALAHRISREIEGFERVAHNAIRLLDDLTPASFEALESVMKLRQLLNRLRLSMQRARGVHSAQDLRAVASTAEDTVQAANQFRRRLIDLGNTPADDVVKAAGAVMDLITPVGMSVQGLIAELSELEADR